MRNRNFVDLVMDRRVLPRLLVYKNEFIVPHNKYTLFLENLYSPEIKLFHEIVNQKDDIIAVKLRNVTKSNQTMT